MERWSDDEDSSIENADGSSSAGAGNVGSGAAGGFSSIRDRFLFKRNPNASSATSYLSRTLRVTSSSNGSSSDRQFKTGRSHHHHHNRSLFRKLLLFPIKDRSWFYLCIVFVIFVFALASMVLQSSIMSVRGGGSERGKWLWFVRDDLKFGSSLHLVPRRRFELRHGLDSLRNHSRIGIRHPRIALILGNMKKDPSSLRLSTVMKNLKGLGYLLKIYSLLDGEARPMWEEIGGQVFTLSPEKYGQIDWLIYEGVIVESLEAKDVVSSLMQEPFCSVPVIWIIQEDTLANRLPVYENMHWERIISQWKVTFSRANVVVFPDYSLPMLYSVLDTGNFFVIPGSPVDVWDAESYITSHSKLLLRKENGFTEDDLLVLVVGSSFLYNELSLDYTFTMHDLHPLLVKYAAREESKGRFKFVFLCGNSSGGYDNVLQDTATRLGLHQGTLRHYSLVGDVNAVILMSDIVLYASSQNEQGFPPFLTRAMSFGIPIVAPDFPVINRYVANGIQGLIFPIHNPDALMKAFTLLISEDKLSKFAHSLGSAGRLLAKNMLASECITTYGMLLENVFNFPSDVLLPASPSQIKQSSWDWDFFGWEMGRKTGDMENLHLGSGDHFSIVYDLEEEMADLVPLENISKVEVDSSDGDLPTDLDWEILKEIERSEQVESLEMEEIDERMEKDIGDWDEIYRNARKIEKLKFETNERDEGELERTGQPLCIYEIYSGRGTWQFLHRGSLYRGLNLYPRPQRPRSDDVDAVARLPILNDTYYRNILCEIGGMFSVATGIDNIHKRPWIGFQSWRAAGGEVALSTKAEQVLEAIVQKSTKGDVIYFWSKLDMNGRFVGGNDVLTFWSMCDILNGGNCRTTFEDAFRKMYTLPSHVEALPPMPEGGGHWSTLHSWVMPTPSFLEFIMFSRMFVDSLHHLHTNSNEISQTCLLGSSSIEKQQCYCRVLDILVNVWAYHSGRKMVYIDPHSGELEEQHRIEQRKGFMWAKYFNISLLRSMDEDLAEAADDNDHPYEMWLWPLTGEVYWQGIYEREREERYRLKMDKKRKTREKLLERMRYGYKQKTLGRLKLASS